MSAAHVVDTLGSHILMDAKKLLLALTVVFVGFWMFTDPRSLADAAGQGAGAAWSLTTQFFGAVIDFLRVL